MDRPKIVLLDGAEHVAINPKARAWFRISELDENIEKSKNPALDYAELIATAFDGVTADDVLDSLNVEDLKPKATEIALWIFTLINSKMRQLPNVKSQESQDQG